MKAQLCQISLAASLALIAGCSPGARMSSEERRAANQCLSNLVCIYFEFKAYTGNGILYPPCFAALTNVSKAVNCFVCPSTGHKPLQMDQADDWTDYVLVANQDDTPFRNFPVVICPAENHSNKFGHVLYRDSHRARLPPDQIRTLIEVPWAKAEGIPDFALVDITNRLVVRVPARLRDKYPNAYRPKAATP